MKALPLHGVQSGFARLRMLMFTGDMVTATVLYDVGAGLMEAERDTAFKTLAVQVEHPVEVEVSGIFA